jgi:hypothetical protein
MSSRAVAELIGCLHHKVEDEEFRTQVGKLPTSPASSARGCGLPAPAARGGRDGNARTAARVGAGGGRGPGARPRLGPGHHPRILRPAGTGSIRRVGEGQGGGPVAGSHPRRGGPRRGAHAAGPAGPRPMAETTPGDEPAGPAPQPGSPQEIEAFRRLQARLPRLFRDQAADPRAPRTVVVVPSLSVDQEVMAQIPGVHHYEERMLGGFTWS